MENDAKAPLFTKKRIIILAIVLVLLIIFGIFIFFRPKTIKVERVEVAHTNVSLKPGETFMLRAYVYPSNATNKALQYTTTDNTIITVTNSGLITAIKEGTAQIVVKSADSNIVAACDVVVSKNPDQATQLVFDSLETTISKGAKRLLTLTVIPDTASIPTLTFTSSDSNIVSVDENGYITGNNVGTAIITATGSNQNNLSLNATIKINVIENPTNNNNQGNNPDPTPVIKVESISLNKTELSLEIGKEYQLVPTINSTGGTPTVTWKSSDEAVATVDNTGKVKGIKEGKLNITAIAGDKSISIPVSIMKSSSTSGGTSTRDTTNPNITLTVLSTPGTTGWYSSEVLAKVEATDKSGIASLNYCITGGSCQPTASIANGGTVRVTKSGMVLVVYAVDKKGNTSSKITSTFNIDSIKPNCYFTIGNTKITNGSYTFAGSTVSYNLAITGEDSQSGVASIKLPSGTVQNQTFTHYFINKNQTYTATVSDKAGNTNTCTINVSGMNQDLVKPSCTLNYALNSNKLTATLTVNSSDKDLAVQPYSFRSSSEGFGSSKTLIVNNNGIHTAYVKDLSGNVGQCSTTVSGILADVTSPIISINASGITGLDGWYKESNITVKATTNETTKIMTYCKTTSLDCNPTTVYPSAGISLGNGKWFVKIKATDYSGNSSTKSASYKVDTTKPTCSFTTPNLWGLTKTLTLSGSDTYSGLSGITIMPYAFVRKSTTSVAVSTPGVYRGVCTDVAGNSTSKSLNIVSRTEYNTRTCQTCSHSNIVMSYTFGSWTNVGTGCYNSIQLPNKLDAEDEGLTTFYTCSATHGGTPCPGYQYTCIKNTRTKTPVYGRSCLFGCDVWNTWNGYQYLTSAPTAYSTFTSKMEVKSRIVLNAQ